LFTSGGFLNAAVLAGKVTDNEGQALSGVSIYIDGTAKGTITNHDGSYTLKNVGNGRYFLVASMLGFKKERIEIFVHSADVNADFTLSQVSVDFNEVLVTANKHDENLRNVPIAITAISEDKIADLNIRDRTDLMASAPNTLIAETGSHMTDLISIRGMFPSNPFQSTTLFFYDGVPILGYGQNPMILTDLERIEIIRGPQGTLYGRNALGGVINVISKKPTNKSNLNGSFSYGNNNNYNANFGYSGPIIKDNLFFRASGYYYSKDGFYTNTFLNVNSGGSKGYGGTVNLKAVFNESFIADLFGNMEFIDENVWPFASSPEEALKNPYKIKRNFESYIKKLNLMGSLKLTYKTGFMDIVSTSAYEAVPKLDWYYDADFTEQNIYGYRETSPFKMFTEELRFESSADMITLRWVAGIFYSTDRNDDDYRIIIESDAVKSDPILGKFLKTLENPTKGNHANQGMAAFGQATYSFLDKLDLTVGLRYDKQDVQVDTRTYYEFTSDLPKIPDLILGFLSKVDTSKDKKSYEYVSQKYALSYKIDESNTVYFSASSGFHNGAFNSGANKDHPFYEPENTWNYELGYKAKLLDNHALLNITGFLIDWNKQQVLTIGDMKNPLQTITNAGRSQNKGVEFEFSAILFKGFMCSINLGYLDAKFKDFTFKDVKDGNDTVYNFAGNRLPFAPDANARVNVRYEEPLNLFGTGFNITTNLDYQYLDYYYMSHVNNGRSTARNLLNGSIGAYLKNYDLIFWMKNILDYRYIYAIYEYRGGTQAYLGAPRTLGVTLNIKI